MIEWLDRGSSRGVVTTGNTRMQQTATVYIEVLVALTPQTHTRGRQWLCYFSSSGNRTGQHHVQQALVSLFTSNSCLAFSRSSGKTLHEMSTCLLFYPALNSSLKQTQAGVLFVCFFLIFFLFLLKRS